MSNASDNSKNLSEFRSLDQLHSPFFAARFTLYLLVIVAIFQWVAVSVSQYGWETVILEHNTVENARLALALTTAGLCWFWRSSIPEAEGCMS